MAFVPNFQYPPTKIGTTPNGAKYRIDGVPCGELCSNGTQCPVKHRLYLQFRDPFKNTRSKMILFKCQHWMMAHNSPGSVLWDVDLEIGYADELNGCPVDGSAISKWERIHDGMSAKFPNVNFKKNPKLEHREGKGVGGIREWRGSVKDHYEDIIERGGTCGDVWDYSVLREAANATIVFDKISKRDEMRVKSMSKQMTLEYDSSECVCGHEIGAHTNGRCPVCKKFCDV